MHDWQCSRVTLRCLPLSLLYRSIGSSQTEDDGDRLVLPGRNFQPDGLRHCRLLSRQRYGRQLVRERNKERKEPHKALPWRRFSLAVKRHRVVEPTGRSTPEQRAAWRPPAHEQPDNSSQRSGGTRTGFYWSPLNWLFCHMIVWCGS